MKSVVHGQFSAMRGESSLGLPVIWQCAPHLAVLIGHLLSYQLSLYVICRLILSHVRPYHWLWTIQTRGGVVTNGKNKIYLCSPPVLEPLTHSLVLEQTQAALQAASASCQQHWGTKMVGGGQCKIWPFSLSLVEAPLFTLNRWRGGWGQIGPNLQPTEKSSHARMTVFQMVLFALELSFTLSWCHEGPLQAVSSSQSSMTKWSMSARCSS